jgi:hypothetical protein
MGREIESRQRKDFNVSTFQNDPNQLVTFLPLQPMYPEKWSRVELCAADVGSQGQGDQIGRIFDIWAVFNFGPFCLKTM